MIYIILFCLHLQFDNGINAHIINADNSDSKKIKNPHKDVSLAVSLRNACLKKTSLVYFN